MKGALKVIKRLKLFRSTLYGRIFIFRSDRLSLTYIISQVKVPRNRTGRCLDFLTEYDLKYTSGIKAAGALSRIDTNKVKICFIAIPSGHGVLGSIMYLAPLYMTLLKGLQAQF